ncbi:hypothetical protein R3W88_023780 [Solanum pinnatisectum]|uniref:Uncharacterized protein n=1 Tax=Solanum pinnatisectum TaxID=50273 RepID=A0AAV9LYH8_9SOLN|nr:hypothetical protein R3W88_023780 [Solanum pinnatisectum]
MQEVFQKVISVFDVFPKAVSWWMKGRYLSDFAGASLEQGRLGSIAIRGGFVCGASPKKMELPEKMELRQLLELEKKGNMGFNGS